MSAALPLRLLPARRRALVYTLLIGFAFIWPVLMLAATNKMAGIASVIDTMLGAACLFLAMTGALQMNALARACQVCFGQPMPDALWRSWVRACVVETSLIWASLGATMSALLASPASALLPFTWPAAPALLSLSLCVGAVGMLSRQAILPKQLRMPVDVIGGALLLAAVWPGPGGLLAWIASLPLPVLAVLALAWPVTGAVLMATWRRQLAPQRDTPAAPGSRLMAAIDGQIRRYSPLDPGNSWFWRQAPLSQPSRARLLWLSSIAFPMYVFVDSLWPLGWNQEVDARHLLSLAALSIVMQSVLVARDLHWRALLMPGGWRSKRIASDIFRSSLYAQYLGLVVMAVAYVLVQRLYNATPVSTALEFVASHVLVLAEAGFALSAALVLRALPRSTLAIGVAAAVVAIWWTYLRWFVGYANLSHWPAPGVLYAAVMVAATFALLRVADRMWTTDKLMACARRGA
jgi:hypothetical protein